MMKYLIINKSLNFTLQLFYLQNFKIDSKLSAININKN